MKIIASTAACLLLSCSLIAREPAGSEKYESAPTFQADKILKPGILSSPDYRVRRTVTVSSGRNHYKIETRWGDFSADGDAMLMARIDDAHALSKLEKISNTKEYAEALGAAAATPFKAAAGFIIDPEISIHDTAQGLWKLANRAGESVRNLGTQHGPPSRTAASDFAKSIVGLTKAKRELAFRLGADPYSTNPVFQEKLEKVAWNGAAGSATFSLGAAPISGPVGAALTVTGLGGTFQKALRELSPEDLRALNRQKLIAMGAAAQTVEAFLANPAISASTQTAFVDALAALENVKNRALLVSVAVKSATDEPAALSCLATAQILASLHRDKAKIARLVAAGDLPAAIATDGRLIVPLPWDTIYWSRNSERILNEAIASQPGQPDPPLIAVAGNATPRAAAELAKRKITLLTHALDGPQK